MESSALSSLRKSIIFVFVKLSDASQIILIIIIDRCSVSLSSYSCPNDGIRTAGKQVLVKRIVSLVLYYNNIVFKISGRRLSISVVYLRFLGWVFQEYCLRCHLISRCWWTGCLAFCLNFMWQISSHSNHRHPVIPHIHSTCMADQNIPWEELWTSGVNLCPFVQSTYLQLLWLLPIIKHQKACFLGSKYCY